jgi:hypothetical protein
MWKKAAWGNRMTPEQRITELERENLKLKAKLKKVGLLPQSVDLPNENEVDRLIALVEEAHPKLKPAENETSHRQHFANAIYFLSFAYRAENFSQYQATVHLDECTTWLQKFDIAGGTSMKAFVAGAIAQRFNHSKTDDFPFGIELAIGLGSSARPFAGWRVTLRNGRVPPTVESKKHALVPGMRSGRW